MTFEFRKVVVDISNPDAGEQPTLAVAIEFASDSKVSLCLFHSVYHRDLKQRPGHDDRVIDEARKLLLESRRAKLQELADCAKSANIEISIELVHVHTIRPTFSSIIRRAGA